MTGGPERRDESVQFSLKELMKLEDERVDQEREARESRERAVKAAADDKSRRERAELEAREAAANEERERTRLRELEEEARRDAIQRAAIEQARITVEARTRAEESDAERRHEIALQRLRAETVKKPGPGLYVGSALLGSAFSLALCLVMFFAVSKPATDLRIAELGRESVAANDRADDMSRRVDEQKTQIVELKKSLADAQTAAANAAPVVVTTPKTPTPSGTIKRPGPGPAPKLPLDNGPCLNKFDPLCGHIGN